jgi:membrane protein DedA with SNARE-associated domain
VLYVRGLLMGVVLAQLGNALDPEQEIGGNLVWASVITFSLLVAAGIGFPIPEEFPIIGAGLWVAHNPHIGASRWLILPVCIAGVVISDGLLYGMGRYFGPRLLEWRVVKRLLTPQKRERIESNFHKNGVLTLLFARFLPAIRSPIFITAGIMRLSFVKFVIADGIYAIPGVSLLFFLSFWFGDSFRDYYMEKVHELRPLLILLAIAAVAGILAYHFFRKPVASGDPEELPLIGKQVAAKITHHDSTGADPPPPPHDGPYSDAKPPAPFPAKAEEKK